MADLLAIADHFEIELLSKTSRKPELRKEVLDALIKKRILLPEEVEKKEGKVEGQLSEDSGGATGLKDPVVQPGEMKDESVSWVSWVE